MADARPAPRHPELRAASAGAYLRLRRLFDPSGQTAVVLPLDQGIEGDFPELERAPALVAELVDAGATAFIMRRGMARQTAASFAGRAIHIWTRSWTADWSAATTRLVDAQHGALRYFARVTEWTAFRAA